MEICSRFSETLPALHEYRGRHKEESETLFTVEQFPQSGRAVGGESGNQRRGATVNVHRWYKAVLLMLQSYHHDLLQGAARNDPFHPDGNDGTEFPC